MKICRYQHASGTRVGLVGGDGRIRCIGIEPAPDSSGVTEAELEALAQIRMDDCPVVDETATVLRPWGAASKFIGIGLNYKDHAAESNLAIPTEPIIFLKAPSAMSGPYDDIVAPVGSSQLDWEVELAVVIGRVATRVLEKDALSYVAGYCVANDVSERAFQFQCSQWDKGKGCDSFGPLGPWLVTRDEVSDPQNLRLWTTVNGELVQDGHTSKMIFSVPELIAYCSRYMTLLPGDVVATGTPAGVGMGFSPQRWLKQGDVVELGVEGLGFQRQTVVAAT